MEKKEKVPHINVDFFEDLTGTIPREKEKGLEDIGKRVRMLREEKGLSLEELSNLTGFKLDFLSRIENNDVQPQLGKSFIP